MSIVIEVQGRLIGAAHTQPQAARGPRRSPFAATPMNCGPSHTLSPIATAAISICPNTPHRAPFGGFGVVGIVSPMISAGSSGLKVEALCVLRLTPVGSVSCCPSLNVALPPRPLASASLYHRFASP